MSVARSPLLSGNPSRLTPALARRGTLNERTVSRRNADFSPTKGG